MAYHAVSQIYSHDFILPSQTTKRAAAPPELAVLTAVLATVAVDIRLRRRYEIGTIERWLDEAETDESTAPLSLRVICEHLGLSSSRMIAQLRKLIADAKAQGLVGLVHQPPGRKPGPQGPQRPRVRPLVVTYNGQRMPYKRLTDAILNGGF
jgi:endonuclease/exonuclease/phosphatase family metal-dependent hydrolase